VHGVSISWVLQLSVVLVVACASFLWVSLPFAFEYSWARKYNNQSVVLISLHKMASTSDFETWLGSKLEGYEIEPEVVRLFFVLLTV
jgi:hypothetical protein